MLERDSIDRQQTLQTQPASVMACTFAFLVSAYVYVCVPILMQMPIHVSSHGPQLSKRTHEYTQGGTPFCTGVAARSDAGPLHQHTANAPTCSICWCASRRRLSACASAEGCPPKLRPGPLLPLGPLSPSPPRPRGPRLPCFSAAAVSGPIPQPSISRRCSCRSSSSVCRSSSVEGWPRRAAAALYSSTRLCRDCMWARTRVYACTLC